MGESKEGKKGKTEAELDREDYEHFKSNQAALEGADPETRARKLQEEEDLMQRSRGWK